MGKLGRGLDSLLSSLPIQKPNEQTTKRPYKGAKEETEAWKNEEGYRRLAIDALTPSNYQPRSSLDAGTLKELSESIAAQGVIQPLLVRPKNSSYEIVAGERRWRAARQAGLTEVPVIIRQIDDQQTLIIALIENVQRKSLPALDRANALQKLIINFRMTHHNVSENTGLARTTITNLIRLLQLDETVKQFLNEGKLEMGHARALLSLTPKNQLKTAKEIIDKKLSVRQTEDLVSRLQNQPIETQSKKWSAEALPSVLVELGKRLNTKIEHQRRGKKGGKIIIHYQNNDDYERVLGTLTPQGKI